MRNENKDAKVRYPVHTTRAADEVWEEFNNNRQKRDLSWNQYLKYLNDLLNKQK